MQPKKPITRGKACTEALECCRPSDNQRQAATIFTSSGPFLFLTIFSTQAILFFVKLQHLPFPYI
jgi:hypothetical protein